ERSAHAQTIVPLVSLAPARAALRPLPLHDALPILESPGPPGFPDDPTGFNPNEPEIQLAGNPTRNSPEWSANLHVEYDIPVEVRSEEHTSELQSREKPVCRRLLEKKKNPNSARCHA